ncbi:thioredoxin fold domain-containing protein [Bacillus lacus]|uniref:Thioredoxin fold domain-containing protein n=1 Tax=Metabacillus lacus TaxID=1983721 RepID=A0A7X2IXD0_9BACI|nr:thioredoxin family protein [Metabacillus lacus]MRX71568.1 thioredoxin fold domain-containing protein [Metabacillus lacus]
MKKIMIFAGIVLLLFAGLAFVNNYQQAERSKDNPYEKDKLNPATVDQLNDPNYQNIVTPDQLNEQLQDGADTAVYFFSPLCEHCKKTTPVLMPAADEAGVEIQQYNVLEFEQGWEDYKITGTPTLIFFKDGEEVNRLEGYQEEAAFQQAFTAYKE